MSVSFKCPPDLGTGKKLSKAQSFPESTFHEKDRLAHNDSNKSEGGRHWRTTTYERQSRVN